MKEIEILQKFVNGFGKYKDFTIDSEFPVRVGDKQIRIDAIIFYGGIPIACVETKKDNLVDNRLKKHLIGQLNAIQKNVNTVRFFFCLVNGIYYYHNTLINTLERKTVNEIFELLLLEVEKKAELCNDMILPFTRVLDRNKKYTEFNDILKEQLIEGNLLRHGDIMFLKEDAEFNFIHKLLMKEYPSNMDKMCRYTSAKSFYLSLENKFRINSVEVMNDQLETKVIDGYPNLLETKKELADYVYSGFIMSLSNINRKDKLSNWYMYGDKAKGVCFIAKPKLSSLRGREKQSSMEPGDYFFCAPVVYISQNDKSPKNLLLYMNELIGITIAKDYKFKLRFWHFWKYFFKYDYYEEEQEIRLLYVKRNDDSIKSEWSLDYNTPFSFIEKPLEELPIQITEVVLGPKLESKDSYKRYLVEKIRNGIKVSNSVIVGYR